MPRPTRLLIATLLLTPAVAAAFGGWAVVTVDALPDFLVVGRPATLTFMVRQHGATPLSGLAPTIDAASGRQTAHIRATPGPRAGSYTATLDVARPGPCTLRINSGFGEGHVTLPPIEALDPEAGRVAPLQESERGHRLFVAKGCITCHVDLAVGPRLEGRRYEAAWLNKLLSDPQSVATVRAAGTLPMPNLGLSVPEIAALTTYLNSERRVGAR
jgi:mono/diheme cytochrome c family protein